MTLTGITVQHVADGYSRRVNFGGVLVRNMVIMYSPDGTNVFGLRGRKLEGIESVYAVESCKIVFLGGTSYSLVLTLFQC